jgi:hypothetical protein
MIIYVMKKIIRKQSDDPNRSSYKARPVTEAENLEGYPVYPSDEDIYKKYRHESEINPEEPTKQKEFDIEDNTGDIGKEDFSGKDLDIPGAELDDDQEEVGTEDEENNHYSLGGDRHEDLEEDHDDLPEEHEDER